MSSSTCLSRGDEMESRLNGIQNGLIGARVPHWKITRRHLNAVFHPSNLEQMMIAFNSNSRKMLSEMTGLQRVNLTNPLLDTALLSVCQLMYGLDINIDSKTKEFREAIEAIKQLPEILMLRFTSPWLFNDYVFNLFYGNKITELRDILKRLTKVCLNDKFGETTPITTHQDLKLGKRKEKMLTINQAYENLLEDNKNHIGTDHIQEEFNTFFSAGTDTLGTATYCCILAVAQYHLIQDKMYSEIKSVVGTDELVTLDHLKQMTYLDQVIKETLRFFMIGPLLARKSSTDIKLDGDIAVPADTTVFLCPGALGYDPKVFHEPESFDPERFRNQNLSEKEYMPFGGGPRMCIGKMYAVMLMKVLIVQFVKEYDFSTNVDIHSIKRKFIIFMSYQADSEITLKKRLTS